MEPQLALHLELQMVLPLDLHLELQMVLRLDLHLELHLERLMVHL